ncbi:SDR family oxidoreductase [Psychrobacter sp. DAB_AL62B]|uniref:SDR family oxidoreductase n=1 Tax=Psychrobacter sp. DAB_AL62B TaxID=1028420 RepID=UPI0023810C48|nr:SDR family oxidoreductase [Psychrobacter sp. DAB_AL62B]MDE4455121.1 SDR family oxidoreductase [Psychrobacter sp. DAB_AL62B]
MTETILITGGTGKFGRQFVKHFANKGWRVLFTTTCQDNANSLMEEIAGDCCLMPLIVDFTQPQAVQEIVKHIQDTGYTVNHLVNNARSLLFLQTDSLGQTSREDFLAEYLMDVVVPYELSMRLFNIQPNELSTITNIGSQYGIVAANPALYEDYPRQSPIQYGVAKAALIHLTKELAVRFAEFDIRVNCIAYGGVSGRVDDSFEDRYAQLAPSGRMLSESELIGPLDFLVSENCKAINGQTIQADGGWTLW